MLLKQVARLLVCCFEMLNEAIHVTHVGSCGLIVHLCFSLFPIPGPRLNLVIFIPIKKYRQTLQETK